MAEHREQAQRSSLGAIHHMPDSYFTLQIRVLRGEDAAREPSRALGEVLEFFRLPPMPGDGVRTAPPARRSPDGQSGEWRRGGSLEKEVSWFYEDYAAELVQLVGGDPRFAWADDWK